MQQKIYKATSEQVRDLCYVYVTYMHTYRPITGAAKWHIGLVMLCVLSEHIIIVVAVVMVMVMVMVVVIYNIYI